MIALVAQPICTPLAMLIPIGFLGDSVPANAKRDENGVPVLDEEGNFILAF